MRYTLPLPLLRATLRCRFAAFLCRRYDVDFRLFAVAAALPGRAITPALPLDAAADMLRHAAADAATIAGARCCFFAAL